MATLKKISGKAPLAIGKLFAYSIRPAERRAVAVSLVTDEGPGYVVFISTEELGPLVRELIALQEPHK